MSSLIRLHGGDVLPSLKIARSGTELVLSWPVAGSADAFLEATESLTGAPLWTRESAVPTPVGDHYLLPIETNAPGRFFRLRRN